MAEILLQGYRRRLELQQALLKTESGQQLLKTLNISTEGVYDDTAWLAAFLAGMGLKPEELKAGLPEILMNLIVANYRENLEENENDMFIAGVAFSRLTSVSQRYARIASLQSELYALPGNFFAEFTKDGLAEFAHFLAGMGYCILPPIETLKMLRQKWLLQPQSLAEDSADMNSFLSGLRYENEFTPS